MSAPDQDKPATRATAEQAASAWAQEVQDMRARADSVDWSKVDWSKLRPQDIGVRMGPVMTEEQFKAYRAATGGHAHVIKKP